MKIVELLTRESLPHKDFFHINEVASLLNVKPHEIRYWEAEFPQIRAQKSRSGQRNYRREDVIVFFAIKTLLLEKKLTIAGTQKILTQADDKFFASLDEQSGGSTTGARVSFSCEIANVETAQILDPNQVLKSACEFLKSDDEHDEERDPIAEQIYSACASDLKQVKASVDPKHVGEMIHDAICTEVSINHTDIRMSPQAMERAEARLTRSKDALTEILSGLDKYRQSTWWSE